MSCLGKIDCFAPKPSASAMEDVDLDEDLEAGDGSPASEPASPLPAEPYLEPRESDALVAREPRSLATMARSTANFSMFATMMFWRFAASIMLQCFVLFLRSLRLVHSIAAAPLGKALAPAPDAPPPPPRPKRTPGWVKKEVARRESRSPERDVEAVD